jgi:spore maturation protein CgeB
VEEKAELKRLFKIDEEMITYSNIEDLRKKIKYYLSHPEEREEIVKRAQQRVYKEHTYKHRFEEIFHIIGL